MTRWPATVDDLKYCIEGKQALLDKFIRESVEQAKTITALTAENARLREELVIADYLREKTVN